MAKNRAAAEAVILKRIEQIVPGGPTVQIYKDMFAGMDDEQFDAFMSILKSKQGRLALIVPNKIQAGAEGQLSIEVMLAIAKEMGHNFWQRLWIDPADGETPAYLTNKAYMVLDLPYRRQSQSVDKKARIPKHNRTIDELTGQVSGDSKGSKISSPEVQVIASLDLPNLLTEQLKYRGGDVKGYDAMVNMIDKTGGVSMEAIEPLAGGVESTRTLNIYLTAMHLSNTL